MSRPEEEWRSQRACGVADTDLFFGTEEEQQVAVRVCRESCPVQDECLDYAVTTRQFHGAWGGLTEVQLRRRVKRPRAEPEHGTPAGARQHHRLGERPCAACRDAATRAARWRAS